MSTDITRVNVIGVWLVFVVLLVITASMCGVRLNRETGVYVFALCFIPPAILLMLWPGLPSRAAADVVGDGDRRG